MKKIILGLFLILGVATFAIPKYVDIAKIQKNSYEVLQDETEGFIFGKSTREAGITVALFVMDGENGAKRLSTGMKNTAPEDQKFISSRENKRAFIHKFKGIKEEYTYNFVGKNAKVKNCYISVLYSTDKDLKDSELDKIIDKTLDEIETYLK